MKRILRNSVLACSCFLTPLGVMAQTAEEIQEVYPGKEIVRVMTYNIWCGFEYQKDVKRMEKNAAWIKAQDPEVVALQELCSFDEATLQKFAKMYGHDYVVLQKENGYPVALTSKKPIETIHIQTEGMGHGFLHAKTYGIDLIVAHFTPFKCDNRLKEARMVTSYMHDYGEDDWILLGDLNAHSPFDAEQLETHTELIRNLAAYGEKYKENNNMRGTLLDYSVQSHLIGYPLEDVVRLYVPVKERMTYPAFSFANTYKGKDYLLQQGERVDYIYVTPSLVDNCINAFVWNGEETKYLSDHYPVGVDLLWEKED